MLSMWLNVARAQGFTGARIGKGMGIDRYGSNDEQASVVHIQLQERTAAVDTTNAATTTITTTAATTTTTTSVVGAAATTTTNNNFHQQHHPHQRHCLGFQQLPEPAMVLLAGCSNYQEGGLEALWMMLPGR